MSYIPTNSDRSCMLPTPGQHHVSSLLFIFANIWKIENAVAMLFNVHILIINEGKLFSELMTILISFLKYLFMSFVHLFFCVGLYIHKNINSILYLSQFAFLLCLNQFLFCLVKFKTFPSFSFSSSTFHLRKSFFILRSDGYFFVYFEFIYLI